MNILKYNVKRYWQFLLIKIPIQIFSVLWEKNTRLIDIIICIINSDLPMLTFWYKYSFTWNCIKSFLEIANFIFFSREKLKTYKIKNLTKILKYNIKKYW